MRIAVVDVAAQIGGARSVLDVFVDNLIEHEVGNKDEWFIITSVINTKESKNVHNLKFPKIKRSWVHRLWWEYTEFRNLIKQLHIDVIFSLQNNGLPVRHVKQVVYFHNVLLVQNKIHFSFLNPLERELALASRVLAPYIRYSWKYADTIVVQGNFVKQQVSKYFPKGRIIVCRPDVNLEKTDESANEIKGLIYPAIAQSYKNFELVIEAVKKLEAEGNSIEVLITISGDENSYAKKIKQEATSTKGVRLIGYQKQQAVLDLYKDYGLLIVSKLESFAIPILEAMHYQTVIVALDLPYVRDHAAATNYNRLYIAQEDVDDLSCVLLRAKQDRQTGNYVRSSDVESWNKIIELIKEV